MAFMLCGDGIGHGSSCGAAGGGRTILKTLALIAAFGLSTPPAATGGGAHLLFCGDIHLSRQVQAEIERTGRHPWTNWPPVFEQADCVVGNLEGAFGPTDDCLTDSTRAPCLAMPEGTARLLRQAGFRILGLANNHSDDLGPAGRHTTRQLLRREGLDPLSFEDSPVFWQAGDTTVGFVAFSMVTGASGPAVAVPSPILRQKLRLARRLAQLVVVYVHWGSELLDWPTSDQRRAARWLADQGADLIIGHHPHVVQPFECIQGKPVFYSLGNHVFDQKYPAAKEGLMVDAQIKEGRLRCSAIATRTPAGSSFPRAVSESRGLNPSEPIAGAAPAIEKEGSLDACSPPLGPGLRVAGYDLRPVPTRLTEHNAADEYVLEASRDGKVNWKTLPVRLLAIDSGRLAGPEGPEYLVTIERHHSPLDHENSPRPHVYEVTPQGLIARWRGTALAWPLVDAALLPEAKGILCALHRRDSFLVPNPQTSRTRTAVYQWNGFGFFGVTDADAEDRCDELFNLSVALKPNLSKGEE